MTRTTKAFHFKIVCGFPAMVCACVLSAQALAGATPAAASQATSGSQQGGAAQDKAPKQETTPPGGQEQTMAPRQAAEMRADLFVLHKQYAEAAEIYEQLVRQEPRNAVLMNKVGMAYLPINPELARKWYERATKTDKYFASPFNNLGTIYYERRKYSRAVQNYRKALELDPTMSVTYKNMGYAYFAMKKYDESMAAFRQALELDPEIFERSGRGGTLVEDRTLMAERGLFFFFLAKSFAARGDAPQCARYLKRAIDEGYKKIAEARKDEAFKPVLRDPTVRELLQLEPLPPEKKDNVAPPSLPLR